MGALIPNTGSADLDSLVDIIGWSGIVRVAQKFGGQRFYFPHKPTAEIIDALGADDAAAVCDFWGGGMVYFSVSLRKECHIRSLAAQTDPKLTQNQIASQVGCSYRHVQNILRRPPKFAKGAPLDIDQLNLF